MLISTLPLKFFTLLLLLFCCFASDVSSSSSSCSSSSTCASEGASCRAGLSDPDPSSRALCLSDPSLCCAWGLMCINDNCVATAEDQSCSTSSDCGVGPRGTAHHVCHAGRCKARFVTQDTCTDDSDCYGKMKCANQRCEGLSEGEDCTLDGECGLGLLCEAPAATPSASSGKCAEAPADGSACKTSISGIGCGALSACVGRAGDNRGVCHGLFQATRGDDCVPGACGMLLACSSKGKCSDLKEGSAEWDTCDSVGDSCAGATSDVASCQCDPFISKDVCTIADEDASCSRTGSMLMTCLLKNFCTFDILTAGSCAQRQCKASTDAYLKCQCDSASDKYGKCFFFDAEICQTGSPPAWMIALIVVGSVLGVAIMIGVVYYFGYRRRCGCRQESPDSQPLLHNYSREGSAEEEDICVPVHGEIGDDCCSSEDSCHSLDGEECGACSENELARAGDPQRYLVQ